MSTARSVVLSSETLLRAYLAGDSRAFGLLWDRYAERLQHVAFRYRLSTVDVSDYLQEAVARALTSAARFRGDASVGTWLTRIVMNTSMDFWRGRFGDSAESCAMVPLDAYSTTLPSVSRDWALAMALEHALQVLPVAQREALLAVDVWGFQTAEFATLTGAAVGTIKSRRARARVAMQNYLHASDGFSDMVAVA